MADNFPGMMADRLRGAQRARMIRFYTDQGYPPAEAAALAASEMARRERQDVIDRPEPGFTGETGRMMEREFYRSNPSRLADRTTTPDAELPGYDPTRTERVAPTRFDPVYNEVQSESGEPIVRFSRPTTEEERNIARQTIPLPQGSSDGYRPPQPQQQPSIFDRAMSAINAPRQVPQITAPSAQAAETRDGRPAPAPAASEEVTEPGFSGASGAYLQASLDASRNSPAAPARQAPVRQAPARPAQAPAAAPAAAPAQGGFFSGMFKDPYEGKSSRELYQMSQDNPDNNALYFRAATKQAQEMKDARTAEEGMKRGGAAGSPAGGSTGGHHKDAAIMKALEIIHHMLRRG